jgi:small subunit ribosomal protein S4
MYGLNERQMKKVYEDASSLGGDTGLSLLRFLEMRLDNVAYRAGMAPSRAAARQMITHGKMKVNGKKMTIPSYKLSQGDEIEFVASDIPRESASGLETPKSWIKKTAKGAEVIKEPEKNEIGQEIKEYLIIEFYSR